MEEEQSGGLSGFGWFMLGVGILGLIGFGITCMGL